MGMYFKKSRILCQSKNFIPTCPSEISPKNVTKKMRHFGPWPQLFAVKPLFFLTFFGAFCHEGGITILKSA
jgi:hypothetical protein